MSSGRRAAIDDTLTLGRLPYRRGVVCDELRIDDAGLDDADADALGDEFLALRLRERLDAELRQVVDAASRSCHASSG
jgi:hypothetical protein